ncbi:MAG: hypothetical protein IH840_14285 [Candidatus Heimdallarchaeota archaeon]|nr:hypothetical protein [Candidatus Heimdallarchaeota archaeon]
MRKKLPPYLIFDKLDQKALDLIKNIAVNSGWDQPSSGIRYYDSYSMMRASGQGRSIRT